MLYKKAKEKVYVVGNYFTIFLLTSFYCSHVSVVFLRIKTTSNQFRQSRQKLLQEAANMHVCLSYIYIFFYTLTLYLQLASCLLQFRKLIFPGCFISYNFDLLKVK